MRHLCRNQNHRWNRSLGLFHQQKNELKTWTTANKSDTSFPIFFWCTKCCHVHLIWKMHCHYSCTRLKQRSHFRRRVASLCLSSGFPACQLGWDSGLPLQRWSWLTKLPKCRADFETKGKQPGSLRWYLCGKRARGALKRIENEAPEAELGEPQR